MQPLADLARRFRFNESLAGTVCEGLSADDWCRRPSEAGGNTAHWILGHLAASRRHLARRLGVEIPEEEWEASFAMRATPETTEGYPSPGVLLEELRATGERLAQRLSSMSDDEAAAEWGSTFPDGSSTLGGGAHFLHFHETYHLGQIGLLRRICGKPGFA